MSTNLKHAREGSPPEGANKRFRSEVLTFKNRDGQVQATHTWFADDKMVALRTPPRSDSENHESIFLANRGILCRDSLVFRDILSIPAPENPKEEDVYQGHPLNTVQDDPRDLQDFLQAIHDWRAYSDSPKIDSIISVVALLRLGTKYQITFLRRKMLEKLTEHLPKSHKDLSTWSDDDHMHVEQDLADLAVLEEVDYPLLLPAATYMCAVSYDKEELLGAPVGIARPADRNSGDVWFFSERSRSRALGMKAAASTLYCRTMLAAFAFQHQACATPTACSSVLAHWAYWYDEEGDRSFLLQHPSCCFKLESYLFEASSYADHPPICSDCVSYAEPLLQAEFKATWDELPAILGLGTWGTLKAQSKMDIDDVEA